LESIFVNTTFLVAFAKFQKMTFTCIMSVRPRGRTQLPLDGFSWNFISEYFFKICWENSSFM